jgi:DNA polymerase III alpha subunit
MWTKLNTEQDLIDGVLKFGPEILEHCQTSSDILKYLEKLSAERLDYPSPKKDIDTSTWFIPAEYQTIDIEEFLVQQCPTENYTRLVAELELYHQNNMMPVLRAMKYIVDTLRKNGIVWGVGRGSSVASYALFLLGVHKIDSVKYDLPIEEFFR